VDLVALGGHVAVFLKLAEVAVVLGRGDASFEDAGLGRHLLWEC
jgi:hypothetical protein